MPDPTTINSVWQLVGWLTGLLVFSNASLVGIAWYAIRIQQEDKRRMASRVTGLEDNATGVTREALADNTKAMMVLSETLKSRTCLLALDGQDRLVDAISERVVKHIKEAG